MSTAEKTKSLPWFGFPRLWPYMKKYRKWLITAVCCGVFASLCDSVWPLFTSYAINHFIGQNTLDTMKLFILAYMVLLILQTIANYVSLSGCGRIEMHIDRDLRNASFSHLQTLSFSYFSQNNVGYIHARVMSDTGKIGEMASWRLMDIVWNGSYIIFVIVMMLSINVQLALLVLLILPVSILVISWFQKKLVVMNRRIREINSKITGDFNEGITGAGSIKTLVIEDVMQKDFEADTSQMKRTSVHTERINAWFISLLTMMSSTALAIVLWKGGHLTMENAMLLGTFSAFMTYALDLIDPIQAIIETITALIGIQVNIERFTGLMETKSEVSDTPEVIAKYGDTFHQKRENWEPLHGDVEFRDVSFRYPDGEEWVLQHFNLKVPQGTSVAIVGETGAGKSTLVNLVCRFYEPTQGQVLIDGRDARERSQSWLHANIGYVLQTPHLFSGTVRENLKYGNESATDDQIWHALKLVQADQVVMRMGKGLDSEVGEAGDLLSTGEKQLLSFARALLADPRILVLDEATSSIDTVTEKAIQNAIQTVIKGRTSFMIAHRLSTITDADVILAVKDGKIVEQGTHRELMKQKGYYYSLYTRQFANLAADMIEGQVS